MQAFKYMEIRIYSYGVDYMSKMADIPIFDKTLWNILPWNQWNDSKKLDM